MTTICPYCNQPAKLVSGSAIYNGGYQDKMFYRCESCDAHVGCHPGTTTSLGTLANEELRAARVLAHQVLDPLWQSGRYLRSNVYQMLADHLGIALEDCHIGMFDLDTCQRASEWGLALTMTTTPVQKRIPVR